MLGEKVIHPFKGTTNYGYTNVLKQQFQGSTKQVVGILVDIRSYGVLLLYVYYYYDMM